MSSTAIIIAIIVLIVILAFFVVLLLIAKRQDVTLTTMDEKGRIKDEKGTIEKENEARKRSMNFNIDKDAIENAKNRTVGLAGSAKDKAANAAKTAKSGASNLKDKSAASAQDKEAIKREDMFKFMEFDRILDGMIVQKNGSRFTKAIKCKGINYDLMSEVEQLAVEEGFITFLNTLRYPIQLYVQAQNIDLRKTIEIYKDNVSGIEEQYNEVNEKYNKMVSAFDVDEKKQYEVTKEKDSITNLYEYSRDMIKYVEKMDKNKKMLQRSFYILISYSTSEIPSVEKFNKDELIEMCSTELTTRCQAIVSALMSCSVSGSILDSNELAELLYNAYNRDDAGVMNVKDNLESGFYRLYSVSEDAFTKKQDALEDYLNAQAQLKALESIKYAIMNNEYETPAMEALKEEEEISKRATAMVNREDYEPDFKDKVNKKILSDYRDVKKELLEEDAEEKKIVVEQSKADMEELERLKVKVENYESENPIINKVKAVEEQAEENDKLDENVPNELPEGQEESTNLYDNRSDDDDESIV